MLVEGRSSYESCLQRTSSLFSSRRRSCPVLKHNRVSEVFKGFKVHDFEHYGFTVKEITFEMEI